MDSEEIELCVMESWIRNGKTIYRIAIDSTGLVCVCDDRGLYNPIKEMIKYLEKQLKDLEERLK